MLLLNTLRCAEVDDISYVSIHLMLLLNIVLRISFLSSARFNTSYVVIKHNVWSAQQAQNQSFNTSYVVIKLEDTVKADPNISFNTSYVVIKP